MRIWVTHPNGIANGRYINPIRHERKPIGVMKKTRDVITGLTNTLDKDTVPNECAINIQVPVCAHSGIPVNCINQ